MPYKTILVVDDEPAIVDVIASYLRNHGFSVIESLSGIDALERFEELHPDLIILDLMLPDMMGEEICRRVRSKSRVPIIMLTAKVDEEDILNGLDLGADDYITKPFSPRQLVARVEALFRRTSRELVPLSKVISFRNQDLLVDSLRHEVRKAGQIINLTPNEYKILMVILKYPQKTFTRSELVSLAFGDDYEGFDRTIDSYIKNLRQKIEDDPKNPDYILTVHGVGYRFGGD